MSPNCTSRSMAATRPGKRMASAAERLVATAVLPDPPLGDTTTMTLPLRLGGGREPLVALTETGMPARRSATVSWSAAGA